VTYYPPGTYGSSSYIPAPTHGHVEDPVYENVALRTGEEHAAHATPKTTAPPSNALQSFVSSLMPHRLFAGPPRFVGDPGDSSSIDLLTLIGFGVVAIVGAAYMMSEGHPKKNPLSPTARRRRKRKQMSKSADPFAYIKLKSNGPKSYAVRVNGKVKSVWGRLKVAKSQARKAAARGAKVVIVQKPRDYMSGSD
jgi:hypothetical protein